MAITWEVKIIVTDILSKTISITAIRTDSTNPANPRTYTIANRHINTAAEKIAVMNDIWVMRTADVNRDLAVFTLIGTLEAQAKANLEAREV